MRDLKAEEIIPEINKRLRLVVADFSDLRIEDGFLDKLQDAVTQIFKEFHERGVVVTHHQVRVTADTDPNTPETVKVNIDWVCSKCGTTLDLHVPSKTVCCLRCDFPGLQEALDAEDQN